MYGIPRVSCVALCVSSSSSSRVRLFLTPQQSLPTEKSHVPWGLEGLLGPSFHRRTMKTSGFTPLFLQGESYCLSPTQLNLRQDGVSRMDSLEGIAFFWPQISKLGFYRCGKTPGPKQPEEERVYFLLQLVVQEIQGKNPVQHPGG